MTTELFPTIDPAMQLEIDALRSVIVVRLVELATELDMLNALAMAPRQQKNFMVSAAAMLEQDEMIRRSRKSLLLQRAAGMNPAVISRPPAPVSIIDLLVQIHSALVGWEAKAWRALHAVPVRARNLVDLSDQERLSELEARVHQITAVKWLVAVDADLESLVDMSRAYLDGEPKALMNAPCPWCDRMSLVIYKTQGVICCESESHTVKRETCLCSAGDDCGCTRGKRHKWNRHDGGWDRLAAMLNRISEDKTTTKAK